MAGLKRAPWLLFWFIPGLLALSLVFTIFGSAADYEGILVAGIVSWLVSSFLLFAWLVLLVATRTRRYKR
jgi:hypothetical protein